MAVKLILQMGEWKLFEDPAIKEPVMLHRCNEIVNHEFPVYTKCWRCKKKAPFPMLVAYNELLRRTISSGC